MSKRLRLAAGVVWCGVAAGCIGGADVVSARAGTFTTTYAFTGKADGGTPEWGVVLDSQGNMYGQTDAGGDACFGPGESGGCGVVFKIDPSGHETTLVTLDGSNGVASGGPLTVVGDRLYGAESSDGFPDGKGLLFSVNTDGSNYTILHQFTGTDGDGPSGALRVMPDGVIYGTTVAGGSGYVDEYTPGNGVLFELEPDGTYTILHDFSPTVRNEVNPGQIFVAPNGTIFGSTPGKLTGAMGGALYSYAPSTGRFTTLYAFNSNTDGIGPQIGGFLGTGALFGATQLGGPFRNHDFYGNGTLFEFSKAGLTTLYDFTGGADGANPNQPALEANGAIVGTTGFNSGILYSFANGHLKPLHTFGSAVGAPTGPTGPVAVSATGAIYGTTYETVTAPNLEDCCGDVFSYAP